MKPITREWVKKAEGDWNDAQLLYRARKHPNYDSTCFHAQQCAEKYLKARLKEAGVVASKTHDLGLLLSLVWPIESSWKALQQPADALNEYAVDARYPGKFMTKAEAKKAIADCREIRQAARTALGLPV